MYGLYGELPNVYEALSSISNTTRKVKIEKKP